MILAAHVLTIASLLASPQDPAAATPFPTSTARAEHVSLESVAALDELVQSFVDADEIVGAELLVIVNKRTILHEGYGWRDREGKVRMEPGGVFCVRSMTKPLIGAAAWMLIEAGKLSEDDRVAKYLPGFDVEEQRDITIGHLLRHQSGLPMSLIMTRNPRTLESLRAVADLGADEPLQFAPGTAFEYSDQGTDTLAAVIEVVTGAPTEAFVRERLLVPLGMSETACVLPTDHPLRARVCSNYAGSPGAWSRYWSPTDEALFPIFLGSQALYSTAVDYARFLQLYVDDGSAGGEQLLSSSSIRHTLEPGRSPLPWQTGLSGLRADYGTLMQLWTRAAEDGAREVVVFGHTGSDGTYAWAFPEADALVLYFTQSRGTSTGWRVEERLSELFLGVPVEANEAAPQLDDYLGYYRGKDTELYRAIVRDGDGLALEVPGKAIAPLEYMREDRWKARLEPAVLAFERDDAGRVTGFSIGEKAKKLRFTPSVDLPPASEVAARVVAAHHLERLADAGVVRMHGRVELPKLGRSGESVEWLAAPDLWRADEKFGDQTGSFAFDGSTMRSSTGAEPAEPLEGMAAELLPLYNPFRKFGDWRRAGTTLTVIQEMQEGDAVTLVMRAGDVSAPAPTIFVDRESGHVMHIASMTFIEGLGRIGNRSHYSDFRDVGGALLPWRTESELAHPLIGTVVTIVEGAETGVDVPEGWFELRE